MFSSVFNAIRSVFKYDPTQVRDSHGRWATGPMGAAGELASKKNIRDYSVVSVVKDALGNDPATIKAYHDSLAEVSKLTNAGKETSHIHSKNGDGTGGYTDERKAYHKKIMEYFFKNKEAYLPKEGEAPKLMILGGRGGSGKSNFNKDDNKEFGVYSKNHFLVIDADAIKEMLPEYVPSHAYLSHAESSYLADRITAAARRYGLNTVMDITLRSPQSRVLSSFKKKGYSTEVHFMHKDPKGALTGAVRRWNRKSVITNPITKEAKVFPKGRLVPPEVIEANIHNEKNFDTLSKHADHWSVVANESPDGFQGRKVAQKVKKLDTFSSVFKENPYHDASGKFTSKEKAGHRIDHSKGFASVLSSIGVHGKDAQMIMELAKANHAKAKEHGVTDVALASSWLKAGHTHETLSAVGINLTDAEKKSFAHWSENNKGSEAKLKTFVDKTYPAVFSEYQDALDTHGADSAQAKKAAKKNVEYIKQAYLYGATHDQVDHMQSIALEKHTKSKEAPEPVEPPALSQPKFRPVEDSITSESINIKLGKHYYTLRTTLGQNHPDVKVAYDEWQKSKDHLTSQFGYSKSQIGALSSDAKNFAEVEAKHAIAEKAKAKLAHLGHLTYLGKASHLYGDSIPDTAINEAKAVGVSQSEIDMALHTGKEQGVSEKAKIKEVASTAIKSASTVVESSKDTFGVESKEHWDALTAYQAAIKAHQGDLTLGEIKTLRQAGEDHYHANKKAMAGAVAKYGSASAVVKSYDSQADSFGYLNGDSGFSKHSKAQIDKLTPDEIKVIKDYTGSAFTSLNRAVGKAGTAVMLGQEGDTFTSADASRMENMDSAFAKTTLGKNVNLRRNMAQKYFWQQLGYDVTKVDSLTEDQLKGLTGKIYKETAYSSTSMDAFFTGQFQTEAGKTGGAVLRIRAGKNMPGLRAKALSGHAAEEEVILPRGTTYVIRGITKLAPDPYNQASPRFEIHVDMIGAFPDKIKTD